ncbi:MAG: D-alanyl-D-alanine carboxypeptidase [Fimbriimonadaceae bacterium]
MRGKLPKEGAEVGEYALPNPSQAVAKLLGGRLKFITTEALPEREADYRIDGPTIGELVKAALEPSDNIITEHLLMRAGGLGGYEGKDPYATAAAELNKYMAEVVKVPEDSVRAQDGSGMSRHNFVTGRAMAQILRHVSTKPFFQIFLDALPQPGEGTLSNRLKGLPVSAKTGTLDAVCSLSGYVQPPGQEPVILR